MNLSNRADRHVAEMAVGVLLLGWAGLSLSGLIGPYPKVLWLFAAYGALVVAVEIVGALHNDDIDPTLWSGITGYIAGGSIVWTRLALGVPVNDKIWAASALVLVTITAALAVTWQGRRLPVRTAGITVIIAAALCIGLTFAVPLVRAYALTNSQITVWTIAVFVALAITLLLLFLNERVFEKRRSILQKLLDDLALYGPDLRQDSYSLLKLAANKYSTKLRPGRTFDAGNNDNHLTGSPAESRWPLILSATAYMAFCIMGYILLLTPLCLVFGVGNKCSDSWLSAALFWTNVNPAAPADLMPTVAIAGAAFLGAHIFTLRFLFKAALNTELNQFKWIRGGLHLLTGVVVAIIFYRALNGVAAIGGVTISPAIWLGLAFFAGWSPDFALTNMIRRFGIWSLKSTDDEISKLVSIVPVEVIDGIDYDTRYRLEENNIVDVQSLAACNPILLYVETPFGLAQIFDWILQAQLCLAVGPKPYIELKKIGVRTIYQLQDEVGGNNLPYIRMIGNAMYSAAPAGRTAPIMVTPPGGTTPDLDPEAVKFAVSAWGRDPYLTALRSLWQYVYG